MVLLRQRLIFYKMGFTVPLVLMIILLTACDRPPVVSNLASETIGYPKTIITALGKAEILPHLAKRKLTNHRDGLWHWEAVVRISY